MKNNDKGNCESVFALPLWLKNHRAGPGEHDYGYEGQTRRTAQAQTWNQKLDGCCLQVLLKILGR